MILIWSVNAKKIPNNIVTKNVNDFENIKFKESLLA